VELTKQVRAQQLEPAAMLALGRDVYFRFEGFAAGVAAQRDKLRQLEEAAWPAPLDAPVRLKVAALPTQFAQVEKALAPLQARLEWLPMLGIGFAHADRPEGIDGARREILALGGSLVVEKAPSPVDAFGPPPPSVALQKEVKARLDPRGLFAPGRFVGGI
jgi:hypothetical protein